MINVGAGNIQAIKVGIEDATKAYQGDTLVWSKEHRVYTAMTCEYRILTAGTYQICSANAAAQQETIVVDGAEVPSTTALTFDVGTHEVEFPGIIAALEHGYFKEIDTLVVAHFPSTMVFMGPSVFYGCANLEHADMSGTQIASFNGHSFENCSSLMEIKISPVTTMVNGGEFYGCESVTSVTLNNVLTSIKEGAFYNNGRSSVSYPGIQIEFPASLKSIGFGAFSNARINYVGLNEGLETIDGMAFYNTYPPDVWIPSTVTYIGDSAFGEVTASEIRFLSATPPTFGTDVFYGRESPWGFSQGIKVPAASVELYKAALPQYADQIVGY